MNERIIFDLDGTLIESEQLWHDVRRDFVIAHSGQWHARAQTTMMGMRTAEWAIYMHDALGVALAPDDIARQVTDEIVARVSQDVPVLPGAEDALTRLNRVFGRFGLATSSPLIVARTVLAKTGWDELFEAVVSADEVARGKPAPDVYLRTLDVLRAGARGTAAIEDSANGIRSAATAQLAVIAIPNTAFPPAADALAMAARVLPSLRELDADTVRGVLTPRISSCASFRRRESDSDRS